MKKYTPNQYVDIFDKLPMEIKDLIVSTSTTDHITIIGKKHNLHIDKIGDLVDLTFDVMMGIVATKDFVKELQDALQINALEAAVLARDVDENIFKPIKETMTHLYAGRAPYKPSSSLVQYYEEDEDHPALDKNTLLKEIEDPEPSQVKKEATVIASKLVSLQAGEGIKKEIQKDKEKPHTEITEYHEEIVNNSLGALNSKEENKQISNHNTPQSPLILSGEEIQHFPSHLDKGEVGRGLSLEPKTNNFTSLPANKLSPADNILNQLASLKLNQAFVMPKGAEGIAELRKLEGDVGGKLLAVSLEGKEQTSGLAGKADELKSMEEARLKKENQIISPRSSTTTPLILSGEEMPKAVPNNLTTSHTDTLSAPIPP